MFRFIPMYSRILLRGEQVSLSVNQLCTFLLKDGHQIIWQMMISGQTHVQHWWHYSHSHLVGRILLMKYIKLCTDFKNMNIAITFVCIQIHRGYEQNRLWNMKRLWTCLLVKQKEKEWWWWWWLWRPLYAVQQEVDTVRTATRCTEEENMLTRLRVGQTCLDRTWHLILM